LSADGSDGGGALLANPAWPGWQFWKLPFRISGGF
jgi:hypothetical protein